jgi:hypothetical protein
MQDQHASEPETPEERKAFIAAFDSLGEGKTPRGKPMLAIAMADAARKLRDENVRHVADGEARAATALRMRRWRG